MIALVIALAATNPSSWTCKEVRAAVAMVGSIDAAERYARGMGVPLITIEKLRQCVKTPPK